MKNSFNMEPFEVDTEFNEEQLDTLLEFDEEPELIEPETENFLQSEVKHRSKAYIRWIQQSLNQILGIRLTVDGIMGPQTRSAIRSFQRRQGLRPDGIVGPKTEQALKAALVVSTPPLSQPVPPPPVRRPLTLESVVRRSLQLLGEQRRIGYELYPEATRRLQCLLGMILNSGIDDRYINGLSFLVQSVTTTLSPTQFATLISHVKADLTIQWFTAPTQSDRQILIGLELLDSRIFYGVAFMNRHVATHGAASDPGKVQIKDWMARRQRDRGSVYSCYGGVRQTW